MTAAIYCRLSKDDENQGESVSISTQKLMLTHYCEEHAYSVYDIYVDDGFSGLNFNRPGFQRMLQDIRTGNINLVVTKDLSRLGRDYIQTGYYVDHFFRQYSVRYIAINDGIDTCCDDNDIAPFKNILNDLYAKDISRKVKSAKRQRALRGYYISAQPPYGYRIDPKDGNHLIIDPDAAAHVRSIFQYAIDLLRPAEIAKRLTQMGVESPSVYKAKHGDLRFAKCLEEEQQCVWCSETVRKILTNQTYCGDMVNHKEENKSYKTKKRRRVPTEEQIIVPNTHEPIISHNQFDQVQIILLNRTRPRRLCQVNPLEGFVFCGECGKKMTTATKRFGERRLTIFRCTNHFQNRNECHHNHMIHIDVLELMVKKALSEHIENGLIGKSCHDASKSSSASVDTVTLHKWIDYIEIGEKPFTGELKDKVIIHFLDPSNRRHTPYVSIEDLFR